eukprot:TRINITY_DN6490_c0_g1_i3.p1 TRINITY_DN6490_c0_g1~~TRINITY_DN6490_c0_g1_i3.p1  ORF type:complete len:1266 (+),score=382.05 TRINITY_DN6490_c0_g1_i3:354-3800(+)
MEASSKSERSRARAMTAPARAKVREREWIALGDETLAQEIETYNRQLASFKERLAGAEAVDLKRLLDQFAKQEINAMQEIEKAKVGTLQAQGERVHALVDEALRVFRNHIVFGGGRVLDSDSDEILQENIERYVMDKLYCVYFAWSDKAVARDYSASELIAALAAWIKPTHLGLLMLYDADNNPTLWPLAQEELFSMNSKKNPLEKILCIQKCCAAILAVLRRCHRQFGVGGGAVGADQLLPTLIYVIIKSNPPCIKSNIEFISRFRHPNKMYIEKSSYYFSLFLSAVTFIETVTYTALDGVTKEQWQSRMGALMRVYKRSCKQKNEELQQAKTDLSKAKQESERQVSNVQEQLRIKDELAQKLQRDLAAAKQENDSNATAAQEDDQSATINDEEDEIPQARLALVQEQLRSKEERIHELEQNLAAAKEEIKGADSARNELLLKDEQLQKAANDLNAARESYDTQVERTGKENEAQLDALREQIQSKEDQIQKLESDLATADTEKSQVTELEATVASAQKELSTKEEELQQTKRDMVSAKEESERKVADVQEQLRVQKEQAQQLHDELAAAQQVSQQKVAELLAKEEELHNLQNERTALKEDSERKLVVLQEELQSKESRIHELESDLNTLKEESQRNLTKLEEQHATSQEQLRTTLTNAAQKELSTVKEDAERRIDAIQQQLTTAKSECAKLKAAKALAEKTALKLKRYAEAARSKIHEKQAALDEVKQTLSDERAEHVLVSNEAEALRQKQSEWRQQVQNSSETQLQEALQKHTKKWKQKIRDKDARCKNLQDQLETITKEFEQYKERARQALLEQQNSDASDTLKAELAGAQRDFMALKEQHEEVVTEHGKWKQTAQRKLENAEEALVELQEDYAQALAKQKELTAQFTAIQENWKAKDEERQAERNAMHTQHATALADSKEQHEREEKRLSELVSSLQEEIEQNNTAHDSATRALRKQISALSQKLFLIQSRNGTVPVEAEPDQSPKETARKAEAQENKQTEALLEKRPVPSAAPGEDSKTYLHYEKRNEEREKEVAKLKSRIQVLLHELQDLEDTMELRAMQEKTLKDEIRKLEKIHKREDVNTEELKEAIVQYMHSGDHATHLPLLAEMLQFSKQDLEKANSRFTAPKAATTSSGLWGLWGS